MRMATQEGDRVDATGTGLNFEAGRRAFMQTLGAGAVGAAVLGLSSGSASAQSITNTDILNFALNLEYLEAEFYLTAIGLQLDDSDVDGNTSLGPLGSVSRGHKVPFQVPIVSKLASELALTERAHVRFLRSQLGANRIARPQIDVNQSFTTAARAVGLVGPNDTFDAYANDTNFLLASFIFEDVGVTAYKGAAALLTGASVITAAAGILAVEAYHAGAIRALLHERGFYEQSLRLSNLRNSVDGTSDDDDGVGDANSTIIAPVDSNGIAFGRAPAQVLNIVYGQAGHPTKGLFFPAGTNGTFKTAG